MAIPGCRGVGGSPPFCYAPDAICIFFIYFQHVHLETSYLLTDLISFSGNIVTCDCHVLKDTVFSSGGFFYVHMKLYIYTILKKIYHESMYLSVIQLQGDCTNFLALALLVCYAEVLNIDIQVSIRVNWCNITKRPIWKELHTSTCI